MFWLGLAAAVIGFADVVVGWLTVHLANLDWEYRTISSSLDSLSLATIGLGAAAVAATAKGWNGVRKSLGVLDLVIALWVVVMLVVLALDVPVVLKAVDAQARPIIVRAVTKSFVEAIVLIAIYSIIGWRTLSGARVKGAGR